MSSLARTADEIKAAFDALRLACDERGHGLLDALEAMMLQDNAIISLHERLMDLESISVPGGAATPADAASPVGPLAMAGAESSNVIDMKRYSWRVDGGTA
jgi:hypothetical protein